LEPQLFLGEEILQHIRLDQLLASGMADADAHAPVIRTDRIVDRAQAIVPAIAAAALHPELALDEIDIVMDDRDRAGLDLVKPRRRADAVAARIHEGLGLQRHDARLADHAFGERALEFAAKRREPIALGNRVERHEAEIVAIHRVAGSRIAEPDEKAHGEAVRDRSGTIPPGPLRISSCRRAGAPGRQPPEPPPLRRPPGLPRRPPPEPPLRPRPECPPRLQLRQRPLPPPLLRLPRPALRGSPSARRSRRR